VFGVQLAGGRLGCDDAGRAWPVAGSPEQPIVDRS
jgi:hypothetical protein